MAAPPIWSLRSFPFAGFPYAHPLHRLFIFGGLFVSYSDLPIGWQWAFQADPISHVISAIVPPQFKYDCTPDVDCPTVQVFQPPDTFVTMVRRTGVAAVGRECGMCRRRIFTSLLGSCDLSHSHQLLSAPLLLLHCCRTSCRTWSRRTTSSTPTGGRTLATVRWLPAA
jgi:hypothetical protein